MPDELPADVDAARTLLYGGRAEDFVKTRDGLARQLKDAGRAADAAEVKQLRKPSRQAWVLDAAAHAGTDAIEQVAAAVHEVVEAQDGRGDMRDATTGLRDALQAAARTAADAASEAGVKVDRSTLVPALLAVVADPEAFADLRRGHLAEVPVAGGLDVLTNPPALLSAPRRRLTAVPPPEEAAPAPADPAAVRKARAAIAKAEDAAAAAHERLAVAEEAVDQARERFDAAEDALRRAESDAREARTALHEAQQAARAATGDARKADRALASAKRKAPDR